MLSLVNNKQTIFTQGIAVQEIFVNFALANQYKTNLII